MPGKTLEGLGQKAKVWWRGGTVTPFPFPANPLVRCWAIALCSTFLQAQVLYKISFIAFKYIQDRKPEIWPEIWSLQGVLGRARLWSQTGLGVFPGFAT